MEKLTLTEKIILAALKIQNILSIRNLTARMITPILKRTGFRFSKDYRRGTKLHHRMVYMMVNTLQANINCEL